MDVIYGHRFDTDAPNILSFPFISSVWITAWVGTICPLFSVARMGHFRREKKKKIRVRISWTMQILSLGQYSYLKTGIKSLRLLTIQNSLGLLCLSIYETFSRTSVILLVLFWTLFHCVVQKSQTQDLDASTSLVFLQTICTKVTTSNSTFWIMSRLYIKEPNLPHNLRFALVLHV